MKKSLRLENLIIDFYQGAFLTPEKYSEKFGVGERTLFRDLKDIEHLGHTTYWDETRKAYGLVKGKSKLLNNLYFTEEEARAILLCISSFDTPRSPLYGALRLGRNKLLAALEPHVKTSVQEKLKVCGLAQAERYPVQDVLLGKLQSAASEGKQLKITYCSGEGKETKRLIDPWGVVFRQGGWYVVAYCHLAKEIRLFRSDRIQSYNVLKEPEEPIMRDETFSLERYFQNSWGLERGAEVQVCLRFSPQVASQIKHSNYHESQEFTELADGSLEMKVTVSGLWEITRWILSFGPVVEVMEPAQLRQDIQKMVQQTQALYAEGELSLQLGEKKKTNAD